MELLLQSGEIITPEWSMDGMYKHIEFCGRTCYKSTDLITKDSANTFIKGLIDRKHYSVLEHGTVFLTIPSNSKGFSIVQKYLDNPYTKVILHEGVYLITTNYRVIVENNWIEDLYYKVSPTEFHSKRYTVKFTASIHFYKDITRHRKMSFSIESTRFCDYVKDKFSHNIKFAIPSWLDPKDEEEFKNDLKVIENMYFRWRNKWGQAQKAAYFLPQGTSAEVVVTGFEEDWIHVLKLRALGTTGAPHPDVKLLMTDVLNKLNIIKL